MSCSTATACYFYDALGHRVDEQTGSYHMSYIHDPSGSPVAEYCAPCNWGTGWNRGNICSQPVGGLLTSIVAIYRAAALAFGQLSLASFARAWRMGRGSIAALAVAPCTRLSEVRIARRTEKLPHRLQHSWTQIPPSRFKRSRSSIGSIIGFTFLNI